MSSVSLPFPFRSFGVDVDVVEAMVDHTTGIGAGLKRKLVMFQGWKCLVSVKFNGLFDDRTSSSKRKGPKTKKKGKTWERLSNQQKGGGKRSLCESHQALSVRLSERREIETETAF
jgi:hypothetical protein